MIIYVDADAVPVVARTLLIKTANRTFTSVIFVANHFLKLAPSPYVSLVVVEQGFDVADNHIVSLACFGDLVVTNDIPLAHEVLNKGAIAINTKGEQWQLDTIKPKLNARDFMEVLRGAGVLTAEHENKQKPYGEKDKIAFANALNRLVKPKPNPNTNPKPAL